MLGLVYGLLGLAILIALLGIANTLSLSLYERTRELGLLRAVGQTRRQLRRTVRWESVIIAVFGTVGGIAVGTFLAWGLMQAIEASEGIGSFVVPIATLVDRARRSDRRRRRRGVAAGQKGRQARRAGRDRNQLKPVHVALGRRTRPSAT